MDLNELQSFMLNQIRGRLAKHERESLIIQLAEALHTPVIVGDRAKTLKDNEYVKQGDTVMTDQGAAVAVVLTPEELLRRLS